MQYKSFRRPVLVCEYCVTYSAFHTWTGFCFYGQYECIRAISKLWALFGNVYAPYGWQTVKTFILKNLCQLKPWEFGDRENWFLFHQYLIYHLHCLLFVSFQGMWRCSVWSRNKISIIQKYFTSLNEIVLWRWNQDYNKLQNGLFSLKCRYTAGWFTSWTPQGATLNNYALKDHCTSDSYQRWENACGSPSYSF